MQEFRSLVRTAAPSNPVLTLAEARAHLRVDAFGSPAQSDYDAEIEAYVAAANDELDGWNAWLGRALVTQSWKMVLDAFPRACGGRISLPLPPLQSVDSIVYIDTAGTVQTLASSAYRVVTDTEPGFVEPVYGGDGWPSTRDVEAAVRVTFTCGYGDDGTDVPELIRAYIRYRLGQMFAQREAIVIGASVAETPYVRNSLENYRMRGALKG